MSLRIDQWQQDETTGKLDLLRPSVILRAVPDLAAWEWQISDGHEELDLSGGDGYVEILGWAASGERISTDRLIDALERGAHQINWGRLRGREVGQNHDGLVITAVDSTWYEIEGRGDLLARLASSFGDRHAGTPPNAVIYTAIADDPERTRYLRWVGGAPLQMAPLLRQLLIECNPDGWAIREIGLDVNDNVIHLYPSDRHRFGGYGLEADGYATDVDMDVRSGFAEEITAAEFESVWDRPPVDPPIEHQTHPGWRERLRRIRHPSSG